MCDEANRTENDPGFTRGPVEMVRDHPVRNPRHSVPDDLLCDLRSRDRASGR
jgi:hypothetical protein